MREILAVAVVRCGRFGHADYPLQSLVPWCHFDIAYLPCEMCIHTVTRKCHLMPKRRRKE